MTYQQLNQHTGYAGPELTVKYSPYKNDGTTVVAANVAAGYFVTLTDALDADGSMKVCRPETATLENHKFIVTAVDPQINVIATGTTRTGGFIKVIPIRSSVGIIDAYMADSVSARDALILADGSFAAVAATSVASVGAIAAYVGYAVEANATGAAVNKKVQIGIFQ
jgi:hypothetical protein